MSGESEELLADLVRWELIAAENIDPKIVLRQVPLPELIRIRQKIRADPQLADFACLQMVYLEVLYRTGELKTDWTYTRRGVSVDLEYTTKSGNMYVPVQVVPLGMNA